MFETLQIKQTFTAAYHPQTDGLVERMNQTLKGFLKKVAYARPQAWDLYIDPILFALRKTPQASMGFAPFELVYGRRPRGLLQIMKDKWGTESPPAKSCLPSRTRTGPKGRVGHGTCGGSSQLGCGPPKAEGSI